MGQFGHFFNFPKKWNRHLRLCLKQKIRKFWYEGVKKSENAQIWKFLAKMVKLSKKGLEHYSHAYKPWLTVKFQKKVINIFWEKASQTGATSKVSTTSWSRDQKWRTGARPTEEGYPPRPRFFDWNFEEKLFKQNSLKTNFLGTFILISGLFLTWQTLLLWGGGRRYPLRNSDGPLRSSQLHLLLYDPNFLTN